MLCHPIEWYIATCGQLGSVLYCDFVSQVDSLYLCYVERLGSVGTRIISYLYIHTCAEFYYNITMSVRIIIIYQYNIRLKFCGSL